MIVQTARIGYGGPDELDVTAKNATEETRPFAPSGPLVGRGVAERRRIEAARKRANHAATRQRREYLLAQLEVEEHEFWRAYRERYLEELRASYRRHRPAWRKLLQRQRVVLVCFCTDHNRCNRTILAEVLERLGATNNGEIQSTQGTLW